MLKQNERNRHESNEWRREVMKLVVVQEIRNENRKITVTKMQQTAENRKLFSFMLQFCSLFEGAGNCEAMT